MHSTPYLQSRNGNCHLRIRIPSDLLGTIRTRELVKRFKTKDKMTATVASCPSKKASSKRSRSSGQGSSLVSKGAHTFPHSLESNARQYLLDNLKKP